MLESTQLEKTKEDIVTRRKVGLKFVEVVVSGWPNNIFIVHTCPFEKYEELLIEYGPSYWDKVEHEGVSFRVGETD